MKFKAILISFLAFLLVACNNTTSFQEPNKEQHEKHTVVSTTDDFTFTITSDKKIYAKGEKVKIEANILYDGELTEVKVRGGGNLITWEVLNELGDEVDC